MSETQAVRLWTGVERYPGEVSCREHQCLLQLPTARLGVTFTDWAAGHGSRETDKQCGRVCRPHDWLGGEVLDTVIIVTSIDETHSFDLGTWERAPTSCRAASSPSCPPQKHAQGPASAVSRARHPLVLVTRRVAFLSASYFAGGPSNWYPRHRRLWRQQARYQSGAA